MQTCPEHCLVLVSWSSFLVWNHWAMFMNGSWWRHQMEFFRVTGLLCGSYTGHRWIPSQRPVTRNFDIFFDLHPNKQLSKESWGCWFGASSRSLWRYCNVNWSADLYGSGLFPKWSSWMVWAPNFQSVWSSDVIWRHTPLWTLVQVIIWTEVGRSVSAHDIRLSAISTINH